MEVPETRKSEAVESKKAYRNGVYVNAKGKGVSEDGEAEYYPGQEKEGKFGWLGFTPRWLQFANNPASFLIVLGMFLISQGMLTNGLNNVILSSLERRFRLQSSETGLIVVSYDIAYFVLCLFVTFYANRAHGPKLLGIGSLIYGFGCFVFAIPHFTTGPYEYEENMTDLCNPTFVESCEEETDEENLHAYLGVFIIAMIIQGWACIPLYTVGFAIIENSVPKGKAAVYIGIANALTILGPVLGYLVGGYLLSVYVDFDTTSPDEIDLTPTDPRWVGAWWVGFLLAAAMTWILVSVPMLGFPKYLPGSAKVRALKESEVHANAGEEITETEDFGKSMKDLPIATWTMIKNPTYLLTTLGVCSESFIVAAFTAFLPKVIETQFNLTAGLAAAYSGAIAIPGGILGNIISAVILKKFNLRTAQVLKLCAFYAGIVLVLSPIAMVHCPTPMVAGVNVPYNDSGVIPSPANVTSLCNSNCGCQEKYFTPVCGDDGLNYFSPCFAGCDSEDTLEDEERYLGCSCVEGEVATPGFCETDCNKVGPFLAVFFLVVLINFMTSTPALLVVMRCVPESQKPFAVGLQWWIVRPLGSIPGPIVFGLIFDATCLLWEQLPCGGGTGSCWIHEGKNLGIYLLIPSVICKLFSVIFFSLAAYFYKPSVVEEVSIDSKDNVGFDATENGQAIGDLGSSNECDPNGKREREKTLTTHL